MANLSEVFRDPANKIEEAWRVIFDGRVQSPSFNSKGAAQVFLDQLKRGVRKEE